MTTESATTRDIIATIDTAIGTLSLAFSNGKRIDVSEATLTPAMHTMAILHGMKQKIVDAAAISCDKITGRSATIEDKYQACREVADRITIDGQWNKIRTGNSEPKGGLLLAALIRLYPAKTTEQLVEFLGKRTKSEQAKLRNDPKIAPIIDQIRIERAGEQIDTDSMLEELDD